MCPQHTLSEKKKKKIYSVTAGVGRQIGSRAFKTGNNDFSS